MKDILEWWIWSGWQFPTVESSIAALWNRHRFDPCTSATSARPRHQQIANKTIAAHNQVHPLPEVGHSQARDLYEPQGRVAAVSRPRHRPWGDVAVSL